MVLMHVRRIAQLHVVIKNMSYSDCQAVNLNLLIITVGILVGLVGLLYVLVILMRNGLNFVVNLSLWITIQFHAVVTNVVIKYIFLCPPWMILWLLNRTL